MKINFSKYLFLLVIAICSSTSIALSDILSSEYKLYKSLTQNYSKNVRPVKKWSDTLDIFVNIELKKIANVMEYQQTMLIYVRLELNWTDINLRWNPSDYDNIKSISLPADNIWIPDLHLFNSAVENDRIYPLNVQVYSDGRVLAYPINQLYAHCDFDFTDFPFDTQQCEFLLGNVVDSSKVKVWVTTKANESKLSPNTEWTFVSMKDHDEFKLTIPGTMDVQDWFSADWSVSMFRITIKRVSKFYQNLFIWPLIFILIIASCVFILPPTCVERASMGVLLLLTLVVMSLMLDSYTPKNSVSLSVIDHLIGFGMFMVTWSTFVSTLIIGLDKDTFTYRPIPVWLRNILLKYIGKLTFQFGTLNRIFNQTQVSQDYEIDNIDTNQLLQNQGSNNHSEVSSQSPNENLDLTQAKTLLALINNNLSIFKSRIQKLDAREQNKQDWFVIACVLDRFCLLIYYLVMLLGLFIIYV